MNIKARAAVQSMMEKWRSPVAHRVLVYKDGDWWKADCWCGWGAGTRFSDGQYLMTISTDAHLKEAGVR